MQISEAESVVMDVLWQRSPLAAEEVVAALAPHQDWQEATVKTLLNRLLNKGAIAADKDGRRYLYRPLLRREDWVLRAAAVQPGQRVRPRPVPWEQAAGVRMGEGGAAGAALAQGMGR